MQQILDACSASRDCYISYDWNTRLKYAFIFHLFGLLWTNQFIVGLSSVVVAGAVASFYWSRGDPRRYCSMYTATQHVYVCVMLRTYTVHMQYIHRVHSDCTVWFGSMMIVLP